MIEVMFKAVTQENYEVRDLKENCYFFIFLIKV